MSDVKFIGLDVHNTSISAAVLSDSGKLLMQSVLMTDPAALLGFIRGVSSPNPGANAEHADPHQGSMSSTEFPSAQERCLLLTSPFIEPG